MMMDNAFPTAMANGGNSVGFLRDYLKGFEIHEQAGTDIPERSSRTDYGLDESGRLVGRTIQYSPPNAILKTPHLDSPYMDQLIERGFKPLVPSRLTGPKGPQLPSFL